MAAALPIAYNGTYILMHLSTVVEEYDSGPTLSRFKWMNKAKTSTKTQQWRIQTIVSVADKTTLFRHGTDRNRSHATFKLNCLTLPLSSHRLSLNLMWHFIKICFQDKQRLRQASWETNLPTLITLILKDKILIYCSIWCLECVRQAMLMLILYFSCASSSVKYYS